MRNPTLRACSTLLLAAGLGAAMVAGCGSSSGGNGTEPKADSGSDSAAPKGDAQPGQDTGTGGDTGQPGDGGCNFATFVIGLINDDTTGTAQPSTDLGQSCTDDQNQADFKSLFP